ncbi:hypothetical protein SBA7_630009 [Candidatus Sulfotelmatobacter sp. SbA7]|jgi:hypothetical protein|nr:hypothetical protein SBA7_630009 [Candidatus Sulfotelmatobacter sp. SbA7]
MAENIPVEQIVERAIAQALESQLPQLREKLVRHVLEEVRPYLGGGAGSGAGDLLRAMSAIHAGSTQKEILRALLEATSDYCGRAALFVVKSGSATGWQGRAFDTEGIKDFALDVSSSAPAKVLADRTAVKAGVSEMDPKFISQFGAPVEDQVLLLPLHLKDKVAAVVYADAGTDSGGKLDACALELLVAAASAWLEVASLRKQAAKEATSEAASSEKVESPAPAAASSFSDPFAGHAPKHAQAAHEEVEEAVAAVASAAAPGAMAAAAAAAPAPDAFAQMSVADADVHRKAQRFARLLMDEVKLYNQAKVAEGRKNKDLYDRLKEDIDKSRNTYTKRYGSTAAASADYFNQELIRSLAEDDVTLLGPNFHR